MGRVYCSVLTKRHRDELGLPRKPELSGNFTIMKCSSFVDYVIVRLVCKTRLRFLIDRQSSFVTYLIV